MNEYDEKRELQINALLDGELDKFESDELKAAATDDQHLARAIVEAYQLQQLMDDIPVERAPAGLSKRLLAIPRKNKPGFASRFLQPRWAMSLAAVPLAIIAVNMMQPDTPTDREIAQARQELAVAFAYLHKAGAITGRGIESTVGQTMADAITGSVNKTMKLQYEASKERKA